MKDVRSVVSLLTVMALSAPTGAFAASHREAPITALDRAADITDYYSFVSYTNPNNVVFIMNVDPLLEPSNGPNYFPFDPNVLYAIHINNDYTATDNVVFYFRFNTKINAPNVFTGFVGAGSGVSAPGNAPLTNSSKPGQASPTAGSAVIPPAITSLTGAGAAGLSLQQTYTVSVVTTKGGTASAPVDMTGGQTLVAVPSNVGPRTMPNYNALAAQGIYSLSVPSALAGQAPQTIKVFAGTVDDPFYIDLGAAFDSLNFRPSSFFASSNGVIPPSGTATAPILSSVQDSNDGQNYAPDAVSGYNVNTIAIEVPISMLMGSSGPVLGSWATTSRPKMQIRPAAASTGSLDIVNDYAQVQRMGNPLINELIIGTGSKDTWSTSVPSQDSQFVNFALDPLLARAMNAVFGLPVPDPPRLDLAPLVLYAPPIASNAPAILTAANPAADILRLNTTIKATAQASRLRLGFLAGDKAGYPNGRRVSDDVVDISLRAVAGALCSNCTSSGLPFNAANIPLLGDGVNTNDVPYQETFPYVAFAHSGVTSRHNGPNQAQCAPNCPQ